jgi:hypothetical protein
MEVERFKHRQLAPTVGPLSRSSGEFEGLLLQNQSTRLHGFYNDQSASRRTIARHQDQDSGVAYQESKT